jgi:hypothetical protein
MHLTQVGINHILQQQQYQTWQTMRRQPVQQMMRGQPVQK